jgi:hypothetical protein
LVPVRSKFFHKKGIASQSSSKTLAIIATPNPQLGGAF